MTYGLIMLLSKDSTLGGVMAEKKIRAEKEIRRAIDNRLRLKIVIKKGDMPHMAFFLRALADLAYIELDDLGWANVARATQIRSCSSRKSRTFVIEFSSINKIGEDSIAKLAQTAQQVGTL